MSRPRERTSYSEELTRFRTQSSNPRVSLAYCRGQMAGLQLLTAFLLAVVSTVQGKLPYELTALTKCPWNFTFAYWFFRTKANTLCDFHTFYTRLQICSAVRLFHESRKIFGSSFFLRRTSLEIYWGKKQALLHVFVHWKAPYEHAEKRFRFF